MKPTPLVFAALAVLEIALGAGALIFLWSLLP